MFNNILITLASRMLNALFSFGIIIITANQLGAEAVGTISLIILGISIVQIVNSFIGGGALIYLVPRNETFQLLIPSYIWALFTSIACSYILKITNLIPADYFSHLVFLSLLLSFATINLTIILGKEEIILYNILSFLQIFILLAVLCFLILISHQKNVFSYIFALYISYGFIFLSSTLYCFKYLKGIHFNKMNIVIKTMLKLGTYVQIANVVQLFNYRLTYYFIEHFCSRSLLGIYSVGTQLSESAWLSGKSLAIVQYSKISNTEDMEYAKKLTLLFCKISFLATLATLIILLIIPHSLFSFVFGKDFTNLFVVIISLAAGTLFLSISFSFSHFFSGIGKHFHNSISSFIGFLFTLSLGYFLIPKYGLIGAGITTSIAYFSIIIYQLIYFIKISNSSIYDFLITKKDIELLKKEIKNYLKK